MSTGMEGLTRLCPVAEPGKNKIFFKVSGAGKCFLVLVVKNSSATITHATQRSANVSCLTEVVTI